MFHFNPVHRLYKKYTLLQLLPTSKRIFLGFQVLDCWACLMVSSYVVVSSLWLITNNDGPHLAKKKWVVNNEMGFLLVFPRVPLGRDLTVFPRFSSLLHNVYIEQTLNYTFPLTLSLYDQSLHHPTWCLQPLCEYWAHQHRSGGCDLTMVTLHLFPAAFKSDELQEWWKDWPQKLFWVAGVLKCVKQVYRNRQHFVCSAKTDTTV